MATSTSLVTSSIGGIVALGQSVWFDNIRRGLLTSGEFERMVREDGLSGVTSNPSIFEKAIVGSTDYDEALAEVRTAAALDAKAPDPKSVYEGLAIADLRQAADVLRELEAYERLIHDAMLGDHTLFTRADGIERLWEVSAPLLEQPPKPLPYARGSWGPDAIDQLVSRGRWHLPDTDNG